MEQMSKGRLFQTVRPVKEKSLSPNVWQTKCEAVRRRARQNGEWEGRFKSYILIMWPKTNQPTKTKQNKPNNNNKKTKWLRRYLTVLLDQNTRLYKIVRCKIGHDKVVHTMVLSWPIKRRPVHQLWCSSILSSPESWQSNLSKTLGACRLYFCNVIRLLSALPLKQGRKALYNDGQ